jgi:hypothetical protein
MTGITYFVALSFDVADGSVVIGEPIECLSPAAAIERAQGLWKILGHTGAVAFSRTGDPATGDFSDATVLRKFGDVPDDLSALTGIVGITSEKNNRAFLGKDRARRTPCRQSKCAAAAT